MTRHQERDSFVLVGIGLAGQLHPTAAEEVLQRRLKQIEQPVLEKDRVVRRLQASQARLSGIRVMIRTVKER